MASEVSIIKKDEINALYNEVMTGGLANDAQTIKRFLNGDTAFLSFTEQLEQLTENITDLEGANGYASLQPAVEEYLDLVNNFDDTTEQDLQTYFEIWQKKKAIIAIAENGQPNYNYDGIYNNLINTNNLTNNSFVKGSICFYLSD